MKAALVVAIFGVLTLSVMVDKVLAGEVWQAIGAFVLYMVALGLIADDVLRSGR